MILSVEIMPPATHITLITMASLTFTNCRDFLGRASGQNWVVGFRVDKNDHKFPETTCGN